MKIISTYRRRIKTSRRFVFENIMDLDHVCALHRRWFRNLRTIARTSEYVEYRLQSWFYGLKQDILVKGAPIDANRYWYEFLGPLAQIRVEGLMEGNDGDINLTEDISFQFHWVLAPLFWLLKPLFRKQKEDILLADSSLLERMYELDKSGFKRFQDQKPKIVIYGGDGFFGRLVVEDLLNHSEANITIASRTPTLVDFGRFQRRVQFVISDINDYQSILSIIEGAKAVIGCVGPYQGLTLKLLRACIEKKVHYIDVADDRDFVIRCHQLRGEIEKAGISAFVGCSVVPGISSLLIKFSQEQLSKIEKVRIFITPGTRNPRGVGSFLSLLSTVGDAISIPSDGKQRIIKGWTGRERVTFPQPLGNRWVYYVVDIPDYFLQPMQFDVKSVDFKIGSEIDFLNRLLAITRWLKETFRIRDLNAFIPFFRLIVGVAAWFGTTQGGVMVKVIGSDDAGQKEIMASVFAQTRGEIIPAILPSLAAQMILNDEAQFLGIVPLPGWLAKEKFVNEIHKRGIEFDATFAPKRKPTFS